ncbi:MAG: Cdc6-like AAA superfamily ATPase, partial [Salibacteraceae bacterium]
MDNLNLAIKEYLKKQTNYAVLISGKWGVGKTHYYKNVIEHSILNTSTYSDNSVKYKSVHISLFGLSSTEEIQTQIFLSIYPLLKNKAFKLSVGFGKAIARGIFAIKNLGDIDKYISDVKQKEEEWIDLERIVICFDDLERRSSKLPLDELIGFINTLVENNDAKIILIANEDKIKDDIYKDLKEKVIGVTVEFEADFKKNIDAIINSRYRPSFSSYANFLQNEIDLILEFSENLDNNLRVLIFTLDKLQYVYSEIKTKVLDLPSKKNSIIISKLEIIWRFTIATSIEYKKHLISYKNRNELDKSSNSDWSRAFI